MRKSAKVALCSLAVIAIALGSAAAGLYEGMDIGTKAMGGMAENNEAHAALSEVGTSMVALGKSDLNLSQQQLAVQLRLALFSLGALSKTDNHVQCTEKDKGALMDAAHYVATHPDPSLFDNDPLLMEGMRFCESQTASPNAIVSYMTTGKE